MTSSKLLHIEAARLLRLLACDGMSVASCVAGISCCLLFRFILFFILSLCAFRVDVYLKTFLFCASLEPTTSRAVTVRWWNLCLLLGISSARWIRFFHRPRIVALEANFTGFTFVRRGKSDRRHINGALFEYRHGNWFRGTQYCIRVMLRVPAFNIMTQKHIESLPTSDTFHRLDCSSKAKYWNEDNGQSINQ